MLNMVKNSLGHLTRKTGLFFFFFWVGGTFRAPCMSGSVLLNRDWATPVLKGPCPACFSCFPPPKQLLRNDRGCFQASAELSDERISWCHFFLTEATLCGSNVLSKSACVSCVPRVLTSHPSVPFAHLYKCCPWAPQLRQHSISFPALERQKASIKKCCWP